ncbi:hypothetical protein A9958_12205 [Staphylococcus simulans]|nr:hypothetical protein BI282_12200 [Staphylococcus simulans]AVO06263.1 hypothetical protein BI283_12215 [Staphylococcus simulans]AWG19857.1 hypothetical protein A9958_12205 [Staphylococcus simulans]AWI02801.1 hypothetical protein A7X73_12095 [Staphylococcus simulans]
MQHDIEQERFDKLKNEITLYLKYNLNSFKSVKFTKTDVDPLGFYVVEGYVNNNKGMRFSASKDGTNSQYYEGNIGGSETFMKLLKKDRKSIPEIEKEIRNSKNKGLQ